MNLLRRIKHHFVATEENGSNPHLLTFEMMAVFLGLILVSQAFLLSGIGKTIMSSALQLQDMSAAVITSVLNADTNTYRAENRILGLQENPLLSAAARLKAEDMAKRGYFAHLGPDGEKPWSWMKKAGYEYVYAGENLAVHFSDSKDVTNAWINSPKHRSNLVNERFTETGIGIAEGTFEGSPTVFVVQFFASPALRPSTHESDARAVAALAAPEKTDSIPLFAASTSKAAATSAPAVASALPAATTSDGAVLGLFSETNADAYAGLSDRSVWKRLYSAVFLSPRHVALNILLGAGIIFLLLGLISLLHTAVRHSSGGIAALRHSFKLHRKLVLRLACFLLVLGAIWAADVSFLSPQVKIADSAGSETAVFE